MRSIQAINIVALFSGHSRVGQKALLILGSLSTFVLLVYLKHLR